jgi:translocation and assembly module TamA
LRPLLEKHLDFLELAPDQLLDAGGRVALMRRARKEIREMLATEGYFHRRSSGRIFEDGRLLVVVTPGGARMSLPSICALPAI